MQRKRQTLGAEPEPNAACRAEFGKTLEDRADGAGDRFIGMEQDFPILFSPNETDRQSPTQFPARSLVADASVQPRANDVQLRFAHRALQAEQQAIVEQRRMVDAVVVANESIGDAAQFQQAIPIRVVPRQARNFQPQHDAHVRQSHLAGQAGEAGALVGAGAGQPEIFVDDDHLLFGPAQLAGSIGQGVLADSGFAVVLDLSRGGLANVDEGGALGVRRSDFGEVSHRSAPGG